MQPFPSLFGGLDVLQKFTWVLDLSLILISDEHHRIKRSSERIEGTEQRSSASVGGEDRGSAGRETDQLDFNTQPYIISASLSKHRFHYLCGCKCGEAFYNLR